MVKDLLQFASRLDINGQLYYDFSEHSYRRLKSLITQEPRLQEVLDQNLVVSPLYSPSYLVPAELVLQAASGD